MANTNGESSCRFVIGAAPRTRQRRDEDEGPGASSGAIKVALSQELPCRRFGY